MSDPWVTFFREAGFVLSDETHERLLAGVESFYVARLPYSVCLCLCGA